MNILIAEDNAAMVLMLQEAFRKEHSEASVRAVSDGVKAVQYLSGQAEYGDRDEFPFPDIVLLDVDMPRMTGLEVLCWLKAHPFENKAHIFIFSDSEEHEQVLRAYELGASLYLLKPETFHELRTLIHEILLIRMGETIELETAFLRRE